MSQERPEIAETIERWAQARLKDLAAEAGEVASRFYLRAVQERASRPRGEWGRLGVRVRSLRTARAAPGSFAIEWFTRRWVNRTGAKAQTFDFHPAWRRQQCGCKLTCAGCGAVVSLAVFELHLHTLPSNQVGGVF